MLNIQKNSTHQIKLNLVWNLKYSFPGTITHNVTQIQNSTKTNCTKKSWNLNFNDVNWDKVILYPENGVEVNQCSGKCQWNTNLNNHAKLKYYLDKRLQVCCVPVQYDSLPIMYLDKFGNVVLKNYNDFVVQDCGCR